MDAVELKSKVDKDLALRAAQWRADLQWLLNEAAGKRIVSHLVRESRKRPFTADERTTSYNLGRHEFVREWLDQLREADLSQLHSIERDVHEKKL